MTSVLHVIPRLSRGGAARGLLTAVSAQALHADAHMHSILSLRDADPMIAARAGEAGIPVVDAPSRERLREEVAAADLVQIHFWNTPELYEMLRAPLPPCRLVIWSHIGGTSVPQVITPGLVAFADAFVPSTPITLDLEAFAGRGEGPEIPVIPDVLDSSRLDGVERRPHQGLAVGYVGTVDPVKMHPDFVALCAAVDVADARFLVCGGGSGYPAIAKAAEDLGVRDRFDLRGYVENVGDVLASLDVFGYPLCPENYGASELVVQEAMYVGVPPVVLPYGGAAATVTDGVTGIVARDERAYVAALERLANDEDLRGRLGAAAARHARQAWSATAVADAWRAVHSDLLERPKRSRSWPEPPAGSGAELFVAGLGGAADAFEVSMDGDSPERVAAADEAVAASPPVLVSSDGGVLDYRRRFPGDPYLRLWSGLVLEAQGRRALAAGELAAAISLGIDPSRAEPRLAAITEELGGGEGSGLAPAGTAAR